MAIDYIIDWDCVPKRTFPTLELLDRLKGQARAEVVIRLFREQGDQRPPSQMGFELTQRMGNDEEETQLVVVQDLLDAAAEIEPLGAHCVGCPANRRGQAFGCMDFIQYPISAAAEEWLLNQLPTPDDALVWLLLKQGVETFQYDGTAIAQLRANSDAFFELRHSSRRRLGEFDLTGDQVFEMLFGVGDLIPNHGGVLLLFFHAIGRDLEAHQIMQLTPARADAEQQHPFLLAPQPDDERTRHEIKRFLGALYTAWRLNVKLLLDS